MDMNKEITVVIKGPLAHFICNLSDAYADEHRDFDLNKFVSLCLTFYFSRLVSDGLKGGFLNDN